MSGSVQVRHARLSRIPALDNPAFVQVLQSQLDTLQTQIDAVQAEGYKSTANLVTRIEATRAHATEEQLGAETRSREHLSDVVTSGSDLRWYELGFLLVGTVLVAYAEFFAELFR
jgi:hypothetical protein